jgi:hypothetical protein
MGTNARNLSSCNVYGSMEYRDCDVKNAKIIEREASELGIF